MDKAARAALLTAKGIKKKRAGFDQGGTQKIEYGSKTGFPELDRIITGVGNLNKMFNPVEAAGQSMEASKRMFAPDTSGWARMAAAGDMLTGMAGAALPFASVARPAVATAREVKPLVEGFDAYQGSPHNFSAERLVRMPDGSTQHIVGAPDALPDIPVGAQVLQDYPLGRMRMDKIGTGEGNQSYGYGLYGAETEDVARTYRDALSQNNNFTPYVTYKAEEFLKNAGGDYQKAADAAKRLLTGNLDRQEAHEIGEVARLLDANSVSNGRMYHIRVKADPNDFINYDAPFHEQPKNVQDFFSHMAADQPHGKVLAKGIQTPEHAANAAKAGIPGVKFLDQGSRLEGAGTRNYVMFDDKPINILRKYEYGGRVGKSGGGALDKTSENIADYVADMLRQGRAKEITDDLMEQADPQRLMHHYKSGNTGMDLPMDKASRMARAAQMGLTEDSLHGTLAGKDFSRFKGADRYGSRLGQENYVAPNTTDGRKLAAQFSTGDQGRIMPLLTPKPLDTSALDDRLQFEKMMEDKNRMDDFRMKGGYRVSGLPGWGDQWAIDTVNEAGVPAMKLHERDWVTSTAVFDPTKMRSQFARFDPRLGHLAHLSASTGGAMEFARHVEAVQRAGGQIAPSKYLPNVPRAVHAGGGEVVNLGKEKLVRSITKAASDVKSGAHQERMDQRAYKLHESGHLPLSIGTKVTPPQGWDMPSELHIHGYWQDILHPEQHGYKLKSENGDLYEVQHQMHSGQNPYVFGGGFKAYSGPVRNRAGYSDEAMASRNPILPTRTPEQSDQLNKEYDQLFGTEPDMTKAEGGRIHANGGGKMELRSRAAEAIRNQPQLKGSVDQLLAVTAKGKGVKQAELANAGRPSGNIISKEKLAQHFEDAMPKVQVVSPNFPQYEEYSLPEGENYREHLLALDKKLNANWQMRASIIKNLENASSNLNWARRTNISGPDLEKLIAARDRASDEFHNMDRNVPSGDFKSEHWGTPNVLAHLRMDDRDNGKTLHVQEIQSDWGQGGREKGFYDPAKPIEVFHTGTGETVHATDDMDEAKAKAEQLGPQYDYGRQYYEKVPQGPYVGNTQHWTDLAVKHALTEAAKGGHDRVVFSPGEANADLYGQRTPITNATLVWASPEAGYLYTRKKDAKYDSDAIKIQDEKHLNSLLGKQHAKALLAQDGLESSISEPDMHLGGHGMVDYYNNIVHPSALKLLQQHDPSIKPESYDLPNGYKGFGLPMTDTARQSILKNGFGAFKRGGTVGKAEGGALGVGNDIQRSRVQELIDKHGGDDQAAKEYLRTSLPSIPASSQDFWQKTLDNFDYLKTPKPVQQVATPVAQENARLGNPEYSTGHTAPHPEKGGMMHDLDAVFPDIATNGRQYYGTGADYDHESFGQISRVNGRPNASVQIYRSVPKDIDKPKINAGDWVTTSPSYAKEHGEAHLGNKYKILKKTVRADELATNGDSIHEWGYWPKTEKADGGAVDAALALTRRFTKDGIGATVALKSKGK